MFRAEIVEHKMLKTVFEPIKAIVDEIRIKATVDGLTCTALNNNHALYVAFRMEPDGFDEYQCTEPVNINLDTEEFLNVLKRGKTDDSLVLMVDGGNLVITFEGGARKTFKIRLIDLEYEPPSPPDLEFPAKIELPFKLFKDAIKDSSLFSDKMRLNINESKFTASSEGDFGDFNMEYLHGENVDCEVSSIYGLDYLNEMVRSDKLSDNVKLELGIDMPLSLKLESEEYKSVLSFILAPRIEAEE